MGRILTIRLSAVTYNTEEVFRAWPNCCALAWPGKGEASGGVWRPAFVSANLAPPVAADVPRYSVQELVRDLLEEYEFGDWDSTLKSRVAADMDDLRKAFEMLASALADWKPQPANAATDAVEDALDKLEREVAYAA